MKDNNNKQEYITAKDLPIYKKQLDLVNLLIDAMLTCSRDLKHTLGQKLVEIGLNQLTFICVINGTVTLREESLVTFINNHDTICELLKLLRGRGEIQEKLYLNMLGPLDSITRQSRGWLNSVRRSIEIDTSLSNEDNSSCQSTGGVISLP